LTHSSEFYLAIEGIDGTGKTHVAKAISNSIGLKFIKEPSDNDIGKLIYSKSWDPRTDFFLFFADRIELLNGIKGDVVSDRSLWSTFAYQGAELSKIFGGIDNFYSVFKEISKMLPRVPDYVILLQGDPELAVNRIKKEREFSRFEKLEYLKRAKDNYSYLLKKENNFIEINADQELNSLIEESVSKAKELLHKVRPL